MKPWKIYEYSGCSTCKKALKFLDSKKIAYEKINITSTAPNKSELQKMLRFYAGDLRKLFNTSGLVYKEMKLSEKLPIMQEADAISLLEKNGRLVKRPFLLGNDFGLVGFKEDEWNKKFRG